MISENAASSDEAASVLRLSDEALSLLRDDERISAVYLHGSVARGEARADTDIDLELLLHRTADVGEVSSRSLVYAKEVIYNGVDVFVRDEYHRISREPARRP